MEGVREMKYRTTLVILLLLISLVLVVSAGDTKSYKLAKYEYKEIAFSEDLISYIKQFLGIELKDGIEVKINDKTVAVIEKDSKFADIEVHDECLIYQYGTDQWYECETPDEKLLKEKDDLIKKRSLA